MRSISCLVVRCSESAVQVSSDRREVSVNSRTESSRRCSNGSSADPSRAAAISSGVRPASVRAISMWCSRSYEQSCSAATRRITSSRSLAGSVDRNRRCTLKPRKALVNSGWWTSVAIAVPACSGFLMCRGIRPFSAASTSSSQSSAGSGDSSATSTSSLFERIAFSFLSDRFPRPRRIVNVPREMSRFRWREARARGGCRSTPPLEALVRCVSFLYGRRLAKVDSPEKRG